MFSGLPLSSLTIWVPILGGMLISACAVPGKAKSTDEYQAASVYCEHASWCGFTATEKSWPEPTAHSAVSAPPINFSSFVIQLPEPPVRFSLFSGQPAVLSANYDGYHVGFAVEDAVDVAASSASVELLEDKKRSRYGASGQFEIMFKAKPQDAEPANLYDRTLWRMAFMNKSSASYRELVEATIYRNSEWVAYVATTRSGERLQRSAYVFNNELAPEKLNVKPTWNLPARYLNIVDHGGPPEKFVQILAALKLER